MRIKIASHYFEVTKVSRLCDATGDNRLNGYLNQDRNVIEIDENLAESKVEEVVWHEIVHAIFTHFGIEGDNEKLVSAIAKGVTMVLEDNKFIAERKFDI